MGTPARDEITDDSPHTEGDADGLIRMLVHGLIRDFGAIDRFLANAAIDFLAALQCGGELLASFLYFFSGYVSSGGHQGSRRFGECAHVIAACLYLIFHSVRLFHLLLLFFIYAVWE